MDVKSVNVQTGERTERDYTAKELADIARRVAEEAAKPKPPTAAMQLIAALKSDPEALVALKAELAK